MGIKTVFNRMILLTGGLLLLQPSLMAQTPRTDSPGPAEGSEASGTQKQAARLMTPDQRISPIYHMKSDPYRYATRYRNRARVEVIHLSQLVDRFGASVPDSRNSYLKIRENYRLGIQHYYKGEYEKCIEVMADNQHQIQSMMAKFAKNFHDSVAQLLEESSERLVEQDIATVSTGATGDMNPGENLIRNQFKIKIAYGQLSQGEKMERNEQFLTAIEHYRLAKLHAINVMLDLEENMTKRMEISKKYRVDMEDAYGLGQTNPSLAP